MTTLAQSDLACLGQGTRFLARRPWTTLGLAALGMALAALAPLIQLRAGLPEDLMTTAAITFAAMLPLELYGIPRFLIACDAEAGGNPQNAAGDWPARFEVRWLKAFAAKALVNTGIGLGLALAVLPGILVLLAFGWLPLRVLLKGETLMQAGRGSLAMLNRSWRPMLRSGLALVLVYLSLGLSIAALTGYLLPEPTLHQRLVHPLLWASNFFTSLVSLWLSAAFLALFRRLDQAL